MAKSGRTYHEANCSFHRCSALETFLKGTTDTIEDMDIRFATPQVAVATVVSLMSPFTSPDGVNHRTERHIRTSVVTKRGHRWLIMQDHNTTIVGF
jgi:uncharacterized protein (TIGR02246 family)